MMIRHFTASAVVLDQHERVLLVHHRKLGTWLYPGGHVDPDEDPAQAALREVTEETGIKAEIIAAPTFTHPSVQSHPTPWAVIEMDVTDTRHGPHRHIDFVYVCRATGTDPVAQADEVAAARWVPVADIAGLPTPEDLPSLINAAIRWARDQR